MAAKQPTTGLRSVYAGSASKGQIRTWGFGTDWPVFIGTSEEAEKASTLLAARLLGGRGRVRATQPALQKYLIFQPLTDGQYRKVPLSAAWQQKYRFDFVSRCFVVISQHVAVNLKGQASIDVSELPPGYHRARRL